MSISLLNEYCQLRHQPPPEYNTLKIEGPPHMPLYTMRVVIDGREFVAEGPSKRVAKTKCAFKAVQELEVDKCFKKHAKKYRYRICEVNAPDEVDPIEALWKDEVEEIALTIKRSNNLEEHDHKTVKLRVLK